jgi:hypothetical protein
VSSAIYNTTADFERLAAAITSIQDATEASDTTSKSPTDSKAPPADHVKPDVSKRETKVYQSTESEGSDHVSVVSKSLQNFYGCVSLLSPSGGHLRALLVLCLPHHSIQ